MKIKRYFAPDVRQAMKMVRDAQGPDAVILSNKAVEGGVEIVAAIDYDESNFPRATPATPQPKREAVNDTPGQTQPLAENHAARAAAKTPTEREPVSSPYASIQWGQEPAIVEMQTELKSLRGQVRAQRSHDRVPPCLFMC